MYIKVRVYPKSKKEEIKEISEDYFEVKVKQEAKRNLANNRVVELISGYLKLPENKVKIITGHHSPVKLLSVDND